MRHCVLILILFSSSVLGFDVQSSSVGTIFSKATSGGPDYGAFGYVFAPTIIRTGSNVDAWFCGGLRTNPLPPGDPGGAGGDHLFASTNWGLEEVVLCPSWDNTPSDNPRCANLFHAPRDPLATDDRSLICDPSVIHAGNQYWMYYTGEPDNGDQNSMFLARSADGRTWTKYPNNSVAASAVIQGTAQPGGWGIGEPSVIYKDNVFYLYYTDWVAAGQANIFRVTSPNGISFSDPQPIFNSSIPFAGEGISGVDVKFIPGWNVWFAVMPTASKQNIVWNVSRDGIHWLPWDGPFGHLTREILTTRFAIGPALEGDSSGMIGDGALSMSKQARAVYTAGDSRYIRGCAHADSYLGERCYCGPGFPPDASCHDNPVSPDEPPGFWQWRFNASDLTIRSEAAFGRLEAVSANNIATGWSYDRDAGINDASVNGGPAAPLNHDIWVRPIATNVISGQRYEGPWQSAQLARNDLVFNGSVPDRYHGFSIGLNNVGFPTGRHNIAVEAGEFPTGMGATPLPGGFTLTVLPQTASTRDVALESDEHWFMVAEYGGGGVVNWNRSAPPQQWETFQLIDINGGNLQSGDAIHLQTFYGWFITADSGGGSTISATASVAQDNERFTIYKVDQSYNVIIGSIWSGDNVALECANGNFVVAEWLGGGDIYPEVNCNRTQIGPWERFILH